MVRIAMSVGPAVKLPPGDSTFCRATAVLTRSVVRPYALRRFGLSRTWISRWRLPRKLTSPTSCTVSSTCLICLSAISEISFGERRPEMTRVRIGAESGSIFVTTAGWVSRGNWPWMAATLSRTSCVAASISRSSTKVIEQRAEPWFELHRNSSMPLMVLTADSIGLVIDVSTSSALAPGRLALTMTVG